MVVHVTDKISQPYQKTFDNNSQIPFIKVQAMLSITRCFIPIDKA